MRIGMLLDSNFPPDIRVEKEAKTLVENGHEVFVLCCGQDKIEGNTNEKWKGITIKRTNIPTIKWKKGLMDAYSSIWFVHPFFFKHGRRFIHEFDIETLHVHDLPLAGTALRLRKETGVKVVLDLHENYPEGMLSWFAWKKNPLIRLKNRIFFGYERWVAYEKRACEQVDHIITVVDEMKEFIQQKHNIPENKISVVTNSEPKSWARSSTVNPSIKKELENRFSIVYVGGFGPHRGLDTAIKAMPGICKRIPNAQLVLVGSGRVEGTLRKLVAEQQINDAVIFKGYLKFSKVFSFMHCANVNIIPHQKNEHTNHTVPHKLFQTLQTGVPLLVSDCKPLARIVKKCGAGYVFKAGDPASFEEEIWNIYQNQEEALARARQGVIGTQEGGLNWEETAKALMQVYPARSIETKLVEKTGFGRKV